MFFLVTCRYSIVDNETHHHHHYHRCFSIFDPMIQVIHSSIFFSYTSLSIKREACFLPFFLLLFLSFLSLPVLSAHAKDIVAFVSRQGTRANHFRIAKAKFLSLFLSLFFLFLFLFLIRCASFTLSIYLCSIEGITIEQTDNTRTIETLDIEIVRY